MQISQTIKNIAIAALLLIIVFFLGRCTAPKSTQDKGGVLTSVETKVKTDTIRVPQFIHDTVEVSKPTVVYIDRTKKVPLIQPNGDSTLLHRVYKDEKELLKGVKVGYTAKVSGVLDTINLSFTDTRPKEIIRDSVFVTKILTKVKHPTGLYLGGFANQQLTTLGPEVQLVRPKFSLGVGYDIKQAFPVFKIGINLIKDKQ